MRWLWPIGMFLNLYLLSMSSAWRVGRMSSWHSFIPPSWITSQKVRPSWLKRRWISASMQRAKAWFRLTSAPAELWPPYRSPSIALGVSIAKYGKWEGPTTSSNSTIMARFISMSRQIAPAFHGGKRTLWVRKVLLMTNTQAIRSGLTKTEITCLCKSILWRKL